MIRTCGWPRPGDAKERTFPEDDLKSRSLIVTGVGALVREGTPMLKVVHDAEASNENTAGASLLDEIVRDGARAMLAAALQAEVAAYVEAHADQVDDAGRRLVVRNGHHVEREVTTAAGALPVRAPRVNDRRIDEETGERRRFSSAILPAWARRSPQVAEVLPLLYLHGMSSGDFVPALEQFLGSAAGLSASTITRLTGQWQGDAEAFNKRSLKDTDHVYCWVDGIHLKVRLEQDKVCLLVDSRCPGGRNQGARRARGRLPRVERVVGRPAPLVQAPRHAGTGARGR
jgi:Transposase, Mutator family